MRQKAKFGEGADSVVIALLFLIGVCASAVVTRIPFTVFIIYLLASLVTLVAYAIDKSAARAGRWRIPEQTLHLLAVIGGWPGALVARQMLRHKTVKVSFRIEFWLTVLINVGLLVWLHTPGGQEFLNGLLVA